MSLTHVYDEAAQALEITLTQTTAPTSGQPTKQALPVPVVIGLLDGEGESLRDSEVVLLDEATKIVRWEGVKSLPIVSALRGFSAPVNLITDTRAVDRYVQFAADPDLFNRWEAGQTLARELILGRAAGEPDEVGEERYADALGKALVDDASDPAFKALLLTLPTEGDLSLAVDPVDPAAIHAARGHLKTVMAVHLGDLLRRLHGDLQSGGEFSADAKAAGKRALRNGCCDLLAADPHALNVERVVGHFESAANMTDAMGALSALVTIGGEPAEKALAAFHAQWREEPLVLDKWFSVQARDPGEGAIGRILALTAHPDFDAGNPNRFRALVQGFASGNPARFHDESGAGYSFLADQILGVDGFNPMTAARLVEPLGAWRRYVPTLAALMREQLERIRDHVGLSKNVLELVSRALD